MFLVGILSWWYGRGWLSQWRRTSERWQSTAAFFSIGQLLSTLFAPFRQISAESGNSSNPAVAIRALFDQLFSRLIGAIVRLFTIITGGVIILLQVLYESLIMVLWLFLPVLPVAGFILFAIGWVPKWM